MKKIIVTSVLSLFTLCMFAQLKLDVTTIQECKVIKPTFANITSIVFSDYNEFVKAMTTNSYQPTTDGSGYCAKSLYFTYIIQKETGMAMFMFANDDNHLVSDLRNEIQQKYPSARASYEKGFEVYRLNLSQGGRIKIAIQEQDNGFAGVSAFAM